VSTTHQRPTACLSPSWRNPHETHTHTHTHTLSAALVWKERNATREPHTHTHTHTHTLHHTHIHTSQNEGPFVVNFKARQHAVEKILYIKCWRYSSVQK